MGRDVLPRRCRREDRGERKTAGRIPAVGQEPQEFSVRLPFPFYWRRAGLANFGRAWIRMRGLHLEVSKQDATVAPLGSRVAGPKSTTRQNRRNPLAREWRNWQTRQT